MNISKNHPLLIGHFDKGSKELRSVNDVAKFICEYGLYGDLNIITQDGEPFISTFGIYIDRIADMNYREELLKTLVPMQIQIDGSDEVYGEGLMKGMEM